MIQYNYYIIFNQFKIILLIIQEILDLIKISNNNLFNLLLFVILTINY